MELDFENANVSTSKDEILSKINELDIFKRYINSFKEIDKPFCSELREDRNPGVRIYITINNEIRYKDFGSGDHLDCFNYVMKKFNCTYRESLNIISNDFNLKSFIVSVDPRIIVSNDEFKAKLINIPREKSVINIMSQPWTIQDADYWGQYEIPLSKLDEYNVFSAKYVYLTKGNKRTQMDYSKSNPCYAYRFTRDGSYSYKIYWPLSSDKKFKWLFSGGASEDVEGMDQLPLSGELLVLTKSLKDCICYNMIGIPAISLQGEGNKLSQELVNKLLKRFDKIIVNYDSDERGVIETNKLVRQYGFKYFYIDGEKDLSDYIKKYDLSLAKLMINNKIK